jgi:hypothetical protein
VLETDAWERLRHLRQELHDDLGLLQDSLFELLDVMLATQQRSTLVRLSLATVFRRQWSSTCDSLSDGSVDTAALRRLVCPVAGGLSAGKWSTSPEMGSELGTDARRRLGSHGASTCVAVITTSCLAKDKSARMCKTQAASFASLVSR